MVKKSTTQKKLTMHEWKIFMLLRTVQYDDKGEYLAFDEIWILYKDQIQLGNKGMQQQALLCSASAGCRHIKRV